MYLKNNSHLCILHAISPVHAGAGAATGAVDLPIQRERHTGWPHIQSSGVKGAFRDHCERTWMLQDIENDNLVKKEKKERAIELANRIFGQSDANKAQAGAVSFSDARLLAFPVRSNVAPFVWVICPALLKRLARDIRLAGFNDSVEAQIDTLYVTGDECKVIRGDISDQVILEDICLTAEGKEEGDISEFFKKFLPVAERLLLIPDHHFSYLVETATEIQAQISIDGNTGVTKDGSLRYQELLPSDSVLYTLVFFANERAEAENLIQLEALRKTVMDAVSTHIQIGGDMTLGRGIFEVNWKNATENEGGAS